MAKTVRSLQGDLGVLQREAGMAMATVSSLRDDELRRPTRCEGWTRAHVIAHLAHDADAMTRLVRWAVTGEETPAHGSTEKWDADIEAAAGLSAAESLLPFLAREQVEKGLQYDGELPGLPPW